MAKYQVEFDGEMDDEIFDSYEEAEEYAIDCCNAASIGAEILHMSNPGDYQDDSCDMEYEIIEIDD